MNNWFGELPKDWKTVSAFAVFDENTAINSDISTKTALQFRFGEIVKKDMPETDENLKRYALVRKDDIMLNGLNLNYDFLTQRVAIVKETGAITPAYISLRPRDTILPQYACYLLKSMDAQKLFNGMGTGIRLTLSYSEFKRTLLPIPPLSTQEKIVRYLDHKVSRINKLISAKRRMIELLREQKRAVVNEAVSRGGEGWKKDKISRLFHNIGSGTTPASGDSSYFENGDIPWVNSGDLSEKILTGTDKKVVQRAIDNYSALKMFPKDTIIIAMYGASIGNMSISSFDFCCNQACCCLAEIDDRILLDFAYYAISACQSMWIEQSKGGGQPNISQDIVKQTWLSFPSLEKQKEIVAYLDSKCAKLDTLVTRLEQELTLFAEYRTRLVGDVVVGRVDVSEIEN